MSRGNLMAASHLENGASFERDSRPIRSSLRGLSSFRQVPSLVWALVASPVRSLVVLLTGDNRTTRHVGIFPNYLDKSFIVSSILRLIVTGDSFSGTSTNDFIFWQKLIGYAGTLDDNWFALLLVILEITIACNFEKRQPG